MANSTQYERYERLLSFLSERFTDEITTEMIEATCFYSYRNINRIFAATRNETIGQHIKRLRLEKAAEFLKYSDKSSADIGREVGYVDSASFSKAFKAHFGVSPAKFRSDSGIYHTQDSVSQTPLPLSEVLPFELCTLPERTVLAAHYEGDYENDAGFKQVWENLISTAARLNLLTHTTEYFGAILDDEAITESMYCRYTAALTTSAPLGSMDLGTCTAESIGGGSYVRFVHHGSQATTDETYTKIFRQWIHHVGFELDDRGVLERYHESDAGKEKDTELFIPILNDQDRI